MTILVPILLRLYPPGWRRRYDAEFIAILADRALAPSDLVDIVLAALDAWLSGEYPSTADDGRKASLRMSDRISPLAFIAGGVLILGGIAAIVAAGDAGWEPPLAYLFLALPIGFGSLAVGILASVGGNGHGPSDRLSRGLGLLTAGLAAGTAVSFLAVGVSDSLWMVMSAFLVAFIIVAGLYGMRLLTDRDRRIPGGILAIGSALGVFLLLGLTGVLGDLLGGTGGEIPGVEYLIGLPFVGWVLLGLVELRGSGRMAPG